MTPPIELIRTIRPFPGPRRLGSAAATTRTVPKKFVSSWAFALATGVPSTGPARPHPAHVTTASMPPWSADHPVDGRRHRRVVVDVHGHRWP